MADASAVECRAVPASTRIRHAPLSLPHPGPRPPPAESRSRQTPPAGRIQPSLAAAHCPSPELPASAQATGAGLAHHAVDSCGQTHIRPAQNARLAACMHWVTLVCLSKGWELCARVASSPGSFSVRPTARHRNNQFAWIHKRRRRARRKCGRPHHRSQETPGHPKLRKLRKIPPPPSRPHPRGGFAHQETTARRLLLWIHYTRPHLFAQREKLAPLLRLEAAPVRGPCTTAGAKAETLDGQRSSPISTSPGLLPVPLRQRIHKLTQHSFRSGALA